MDYVTAFHLPRTSTELRRAEALPIGPWSLNRAPLFFFFAPCPFRSTCPPSSCGVRKDCDAILRVVKGEKGKGRREKPEALPLSSSVGAAVPCLVYLPTSLLCTC